MSRLDYMTEKHLDPIAPCEARTRTHAMEAIL